MVGASDSELNREAPHDAYSVVIGSSSDGTVSSG